MPRAVVHLRPHEVEDDAERRALAAVRAAAAPWLPAAEPRASAPAAAAPTSRPLTWGRPPHAIDA